jgi:glycosyltransferase involved in cell wall biosynthesis
MMTKIVAFMNAYSQGKSGGDMVFVETYKRISDYRKIVVTSALGKKLCQENGLMAKFLITTKEKEFGQAIPIYIKRTLKAFRLKIKISQNDILVGTSDFFPDVLPIFWLKLKNKRKSLFWVQNIFHLISRSRLLPHLAQKVSLILIKKYADAIIVDNRQFREDLLRAGFAPKKIFVNYPGINLDYLGKIKPAKKGYDGVFMAQLRPSKGIFDLIKIWHLVCQKLPQAELAIIGKGQEGIVNEMKARIKKAKLEGNISLLGFLPDDEAFSLIAASKIFVFPSHEEGFGIAPLEAQALGLPVVAWNLPVFDEIFPKGMTKIKRRDTQNFAMAVSSLLCDEKKRKGLAQQAKANAKRFSWQQTTGRVESILKTLS